MSALRRAAPALAVGLLVAGGLLLAPAAPTLDAAEVDALAAGRVLAQRLGGDGAAKDRLVEGFAPVDGQPKHEALGGDRAWRRQLADPPGTRWLVGGALALGSEEAPPGERARRLAAFLAALACALVAASAAARHAADPPLARLGWSAAGALALLGLPGFLDAATTYGATAAGAAAVALFVLATERVAHGRGGGLAPAAAWALLLALHPAALFLVVPLFAAVAAARPAEGPPPDAPGAAPLPVVPATLLAAPLLGPALLVALWPALWKDTGARLAAWLTDTWWHVQPRHEVLSVAFDQGPDRAPMAWTALAQWAAWTPLPVLLAAALGVAAVARRGRAGRWTPVLVLVTVLLVGGADGGLFGARLSLLPWLWAPTALLAVEGLAWVTRALAARLGPARGPTVAAWVAALLAAPLVVASALGATPRGVDRVGAALRQPLPADALARMAAETPGGSVHALSGGVGYRRAVEVAVEAARLDLRWADGPKPTWLLVIEDGSDRTRAALDARAEGPPPALSGRAGGVAWRAFREP